MALAEKLHHSANRADLPKKEEVEQHNAPRRQKQATAGGVEREVNSEPRLQNPPHPQTAAMGGYVAAGPPLAVAPSLAGGDGPPVAHRAVSQCSVVLFCCTVTTKEHMSE